MAVEVKKTEGKEGQPPKLEIILTNGVLKTLEQAVSVQNLKDVKSFIDYAIAVFVSPKARVFFKEDAGGLVAVKPAEELQKDKTVEVLKEAHAESSV